MRFRVRSLSSVRLASALLVVAVLAGLGAGYWLFVAQQQQYLESRNFRLLSTLAQQAEDAIRNEASVIENVVTNPDQQDTWSHLTSRRYKTSTLPKQPPSIPGARAFPRLEAGAEGYRVQIELRREGRKVTDLPIAIEDVLSPIFTAKRAQGAFSTLALATPGGDTWFAVGPLDRELRSGNLGAFVIRARTGPSTGAAGSLTDTVEGSEVRRSSADPGFSLVGTSVQDLVIGGVAYKLFARPCKLSAGGPPLMVAGLVEADALKTLSWAIPPAFVQFTILIVAFVLVAWPFLKLAFIGDRQPMRPIDLLLAGGSSVAALAVLTVTLIDVHASRQLYDDRDLQLERLADSLVGNAQSEIGDAYTQLACLERLSRNARPQTTRARILQTDRYDCDATAPSVVPVSTQSDAEARLPGRWPYPYFDQFFLVNREGRQVVKLATTRWVSSLVSVRDRAYFTEVKRGSDNDGWHDSGICAERCVLESVISRTTGEPQAILSKGVSGEGGRREPLADTRDAFAVAALSIPMRSLMRPVLPPGYEFAVIDGDGKVLFHSDRQRIGSEDFFQETDGDRKLRAKVLAHSKESLNLNYWGAPYRAYVRPFEPFGWSVITLVPQQRTWALNREWLVVMMLFFGAYLVLWLGAMTLAVFSGRSWLWPDPARRKRYGVLTAGYILLLAIFVMILGRSEGSGLVAWAFMIPTASWVMTALILKPRPTRPMDRSQEPVFQYGVAAILLLIVSGVVPSTLLFAASYQWHVQAYLRHSHLQLSSDMEDRDRRARQELSRRPGLKEVLRSAADSGSLTQGIRPDIDLYHAFFYRTRIGTDADGEPATRQGAAMRTASGASADGAARESGCEADAVLAFVEEKLPYFTESSVEWRELLHKCADDDSWRSTVTSGVLEMSIGSGAGPVRRTFRSWIPSLVRASPLPAEQEFDPADPTSAPHKRTPQMVATSGSTKPATESGYDGRKLPGSDTQPGPGLELGVIEPSAILFLGFSIAVGLVACSIVLFISRHVFLTGVTEPLWSSGRLAANAGDNLFVLCDADTRAEQIKGATPLRLNAIARQADPEVTWRRELIRLDDPESGGTVLVDDFDEDLEDTALTIRKLRMLEELVADAARTVVVLSRLSPMAIADAVQSTGNRGIAARERWKRLLGRFVVIEWRDLGRKTEKPDSAETGNGKAARAVSWFRRAGLSPETRRLLAIRALLDAEGQAHPFVRQICERMRAAQAVQSGRYSRRQVFDELAERVAPCYRRMWDACSDDEKTVLEHVAAHGLANASARQVVRRLLGRGLLKKDPELRPMNETFRAFVLSPARRQEVAGYSRAEDASTWDRVKLPLGIGVIAVSAFLAVTQRELYNAIFGITTTLVVSTPALVRAVGLLAGRRMPTEDDTGRA